MRQKKKRTKQSLLPSDLLHCFGCSAVSLARSKSRDSVDIWDTGTYEGSEGTVSPLPLTFFASYLSYLSSSSSFSSWYCCYCSSSLPSSAYELLFFLALSLSLSLPLSFHLKDFNHCRKTCNLQNLRNGNGQDFQRKDLKQCRRT